jgi:hypothetical protein
VSAAFGVAITGTNSPVAPGNTLDVTVDIVNNDSDSDTQTITLDIDNSVGQVDSASVTLSGGGSTTKTLSWSVPSNQSEQDYTATVASNTDSDSTTVTVDPAVVDNFEDSPDGPYGTGDTLSTFYSANPGDFDRVSGSLEGSQVVTPTDTEFWGQYNDG